LEYLQFSAADWPVCRTSLFCRILFCRTSHRTVVLRCGKERQFAGRAPAHELRPQRPDLRGSVFPDRSDGPSLRRAFSQRRGSATYWNWDSWNRVERGSTGPNVGSNRTPSRGTLLRTRHAAGLLGAGFMGGDYRSSGRVCGQPVAFEPRWHGRSMGTPAPDQLDLGECIRRERLRGERLRETFRDRLGRRRFRTHLAIGRTCWPTVGSEWNQASAKQHPARATARSAGKCWACQGTTCPPDLSLCYTMLHAASS
jgi:hypothetical protein